MNPDLQTLRLVFTSGADGLVILALLLAAAWMLGRNGLSAGLLALAASMQLGELGMSVGFTLGFSALDDWVSAAGLQGGFELLLTGHSLLMSLLGALKLLVVFAAVFVGRTPS